MVMPKELGTRCNTDACDGQATEERQGCSDLPCPRGEVSRVHGCSFCSLSRRSSVACPITFPAVSKMSSRSR